MKAGDYQYAKEIGLILLAAGASSRLGAPKQLLPYSGQTLLQRSLQAASASCAHTIVTVLGAQADTISSKMGNDRAQVVVNENWSEGMASSIRCGVASISLLNPSLQSLILMVCDQPFVSSSLINELIRAHRETGKPIVTCSYGDTFGPPTLFHKSVFGALLQLKGDVGARNIIRQHLNEVEVVPFPEGNLDIDTEADYQKLQQRGA